MYLNRIPTELILRDWRFGQTEAERLCAAVMHADGFQSIDPQCPLGGPDGRKDVLAAKDGFSYVGAAYFPTTHQEYKSIKEKFENDLEGVSKNNTDGIAFFVNQPLTPTEREKLKTIAGECKAEIYHLERMRSILDSPRGYGIRLEHLRIAMTEEEQYAFWSSLNSKVDDRFLTYETKLKNVERQLELLNMRTQAIHTDLLAVGSSIKSPFGYVSSFPSEQLSVSLVLWLHKLATDNETFYVPKPGELRGVQVWIGGAGSTPETAKFIPPTPEDIPKLLEELLYDWRTGYKLLSTTEYRARLCAIASFHHRFLSIHPFLDANGRVARCILEQQALELLGKRVSRDFVSSPGQYYEYLSLADEGNIEPLISLLESSIQ